MLDSSVDHSLCLFSKREISEVNKGRKMLEKMGWKKGEGLGKMGTGMKDPVRRSAHSAGGSSPLFQCKTAM